MSVNRGKQFEKQVRDSFEKIPNTLVYRLKDDMSGYAAISNPCDFIVYHYPKIYLLECKAIHGSTLNFKSDIRENQWNGLLTYSKVYGVEAGYLVWFIDYNTTVFVHAEILANLKEIGEKSLNVNKLPRCIYIPGQKKRILYDYNMSVLLNQ